ncbi:MAG: hypothetical protein H6619_00630 [Deltaproteobacteria bacterium]|nr:hypothetical protein [Deltaproteobacteria bacterium]
MKNVKRNSEKGSIELIVLGLLAALIVVLCIPMLKSVGTVTKEKLSVLADSMSNA